jgi:hypothetical protein
MRNTNEKIDSPDGSWRRDRPEIGGTEASAVTGERGVARGSRNRRRGEEERERWQLKRGN